MKKIFTTLLLTTLLMIGCESVASDEALIEEKEETSEGNDAKSSYFVDDLQTVFKVTPSKMPELTPEQVQIVEEINVHVNNISSKPNYNNAGEEVSYGDRELVDMVASNYPEYTSKELFDMRNDYYTLIFHGDSGDYYIDSLASVDLHQEVLEKNLTPSEISFENSASNSKKDNNKDTRTGSIYLDNQRVNYKLILEYNSDYTEAVLLQLSINGEKAI